MGNLNPSALRDMRRLHGWSLADLAGRVGLTKGYLSKLENGQAPATPPGTIRALAGALGVDIASITHPHHCPNCITRLDADEQLAGTTVQLDDRIAS